MTWNELTVQEIKDLTEEKTAYFTGEIVKNRVLKSATVNTWLQYLPPNQILSRHLLILQL